MSSNRIFLEKKGDTTRIPLQNLHVKLKWTAPVDLDLHAYFRLRSDAPKQKVGLFKRLLGAGSGKPGSVGHVYYGFRGCIDKYPWIKLDQDAGIEDIAGDNEENMQFSDLTYHEHIFIVANIYDKPNANFASYDGKVIVYYDSNEVEIQLTENKTGSYCIIAHVSNVDNQAYLANINRVQRSEPQLNELV
jgi:tellurite resistance protein TerA